VSRSTGGGRSGISVYYFVRNMLKCLDDDRPLPFPLRQARHFLVLFASLLSLFTNDLPKSAGVLHICRGALHYFQGRFGEMSQRP
jgi:hypothetical protein